MVEIFSVFVQEFRNYWESAWERKGKGEAAVRRKESE